MSKAEAVVLFVEEVLPGVSFKDDYALSEAWNNYTDSLCKDRQITEWQYANWTRPRITPTTWRRAIKKKTNTVT